MSSEFFKRVVFFAVFFFSFVFSFSGVSGNVIDFSPFFPDYSPFDATVNININYAPYILHLNNEILLCEGNSTNYYFNVSDYDSNLVNIGISPVFPFFAEIDSFPFEGGRIYGGRIFSGVLDKSFVDQNKGYKIYKRIVSAVDGTNLVDTRNVDLTLIEINNLPLIDSVGVHTVWTVGENRSFLYQVNVNDIEDGDENSGNFVFNLTFLDGAKRLFNISDNGTMRYLGNESDVGVYNISVCVLDKGINEVHINISDVCGQDGGSNKVCDEFSLTVTNKNRPPIIVSYFSDELNFSAKSTDDLYFNISEKDPEGTIPDAYWYVDDNFIEYDNGSLVDEFLYSFGCGVSGNHEVKVVVTDGLLNDSLIWSIDLSSVNCPIISSGGGGGGGGGGKPTCKESWGCFSWSVCQDLETSLKTGLLSGEDFRNIKKKCDLDSFPDACGFRIRDCVDVSGCNTTVYKPNYLEHCYYIANPSCSDKVKNCHDNGCELLVDCGGPCNPCPTCSDNIKNQHEKGIDCGGPCPINCKNEFSKVGFSVSNFFWILLLILFLIIVLQIVRIIKSRKILKREF